MLPKAVMMGDLGAVKRILDSEGEEMKLTYGPCICLAARERQKDIVELLLEYGFDVNQEDDQGHTPMYYSVEQNDVETTELLLQNWAEPSGKFLITSAKNGFDDMVEILVVYGADVNAKDDYGLTPLHHAILQDSTVYTFLGDTSKTKLSAIDRIVRILMVNKSDRNAKTVNGFTPLHYAVKLQYASIVCLLADHGGDFQSPVDCEIISPRCFQIHLKPTESGTLVSSTMRYRWTTVVHIAAETDDTTSLRALLWAGADMDGVQYDGATPLMVATKNQHELAVRFLLDGGADIERQNNHGLTALHLACQRFSVEVLNTLLKYGANINATCNKGKVPYQYLLEYEKKFKRKDFLIYFFEKKTSYYHKIRSNITAMKKLLQIHSALMKINGLHLHHANKRIAKKAEIWLGACKKKIEEYSKGLMVFHEADPTMYRFFNGYRNPS